MTIVSLRFFPTRAARACAALLAAAVFWLATAATTPTPTGTTGPSATPTGTMGSSSTPSATFTPGGPAVCGDGVIELGETCDDGNTMDGDNCPATCVINTCLFSTSILNVDVF